MDDDPLIDAIILHHEDPAGKFREGETPAARLSLQALALTGRGRSKGYGKSKLGTRSELALHGDLTAHAFGQFLGNGETETGAAKTPAH